MRISTAWLLFLCLATFCLAGCAADIEKRAKSQRAWMDATGGGFNGEVRNGN